MLSVNKLLQTGTKLLRISTAGRLTSWLFIQHCRRVDVAELNSEILRINPEQDRVKDLKQGPLEFKSSARATIRLYGASIPIY